jgi:hypothetical protein
VQVIKIFQLVGLLLSIEMDLKIQINKCTGSVENTILAKGFQNRQAL